ncbi:Pectinesterase inhibitor domain-containing protein [Hirschfeldia incana]|nr:Pectinesterase inhibitor domain-containing protein [Hirschfeldia incana]
MKMCRILSIFLAITLVCSIAVANTQQTVDAICKQTIDIKFCSGILAKNQATSPSMKDFLKVTVTEAERISADTYSFISTIYRNVGSGPGLLKCVEAYARVNASFTNAVSLFNEERYGEMIGLMHEVSYGVGICTTDFNVPGYNINPMIEKNKETNVLAAMEKIIGHMVSS